MPLWKYWMDRDLNKPLVLIISNFYLPGEKSGGGTRTIVNTVERLSDRYEFRIITRCHDAGEDKTPYEGIETGVWYEQGPAKVLYLRERKGLRAVLPALMDELGPSLIYANSLFSDFTIETLKLRRKGAIRDIPFLLAPCGELSEGALLLKRAKKRLFLGAAMKMDLYSGLIWKASNETEAREIGALYPKDGIIRVAPDLPPAALSGELHLAAKPAKKSGAVRLVFLSRFDRKKNLKWILENLNARGSDVVLDVYGTVQEKGYLKEFLEIAAGGNHGFRAEFKGAVPHKDVLQTLSGYHFFVMPTLGENFGHVFLEALSAACPLLISDRTPWQDLDEQGAGWALALESPELWQDALDRCISMGQKEYEDMSASARLYAEAYLLDPGLERSTVDLLDLAVSAGEARSAV